MKLAAAALALAALPAFAGDDGFYPAAQCAALFLGRDDEARELKFLERDPRDPEMAAAFRKAAYRLNPDRDAVDRFIARERVDMALMVEAYLFGRDRVSRDFYERLLPACEDFAGYAPEFEHLR